jgi:hypothetical protein
LASSRTRSTTFVRRLLVQAELFHQRAGADLFDVAHVDQPERDHLVHHLLRDPLDLLQRLIEARRAVLELGRREDVDVPAGHRRARRTFCPRLPIASES